VQDVGELREVAQPLVALQPDQQGQQVLLVQPVLPRAHVISSGVGRERLGQLPHGHRTLETRVGRAIDRR
jgi:hypothetical protein